MSETAYRTPGEVPAYPEEAKPEVPASPAPPRTVYVDGGELLSADIHALCRPPGYFSRWWNGIKLGRLWRCSCGKFHKLTEYGSWVEVGPYEAKELGLTK